MCWGRCGVLGSISIIIIIIIIDEVFFHCYYCKIMHPIEKKDARCYHNENINIKYDRRHGDSRSCHVRRNGNNIGKETVTLILLKLFSSFFFFFNFSRNE